MCEVGRLTEGENLLDKQCLEYSDTILHYPIMEELTNKHAWLYHKANTQK